MILHLCGLERWADLFRQENVRFMLFSYHNLRRKSFPLIMEWLRELKKTATENDPVSIMLDSGVFSLRQSNAPIPDNILDGYVDSYLKFLEGPDGDVWDIVAEVDYPNDVIGDHDEVLMDGYDRVLEWRDQLYGAVGRRLMPVLMHELTIEEKEDICRDDRFDWVAFPSLPNDTSSHEMIPLTQQHISLAHRYGKRIHLFAQTNVQTNLPYLLNADSVDSTTWVSGDKHGMTFIFQNGKLESLDHSSQYRRKFYKGYYGKIGCDWKKVLGIHKPHWQYCDGPDSRTRDCDACMEQLYEIRRTAIIAWRKYQRYLYIRDPRRRNESKVTHSSPFSLNNPMKLQGKTTEKSKGRGWKEAPLSLPVYHEFGGYNCSNYRTQPQDLERNPTCNACENFETCRGTKEQPEKFEEQTVDSSRKRGWKRQQGKADSNVVSTEEASERTSSEVKIRKYGHKGPRTQRIEVDDERLVRSSDSWDSHGHSDSRNDSCRSDNRKVDLKENEDERSRTRRYDTDRVAQETSTDKPESGGNEGVKNEVDNVDVDPSVPDNNDMGVSSSGGEVAVIDGKHLPIMNYGLPNLGRLRGSTPGFVCDTCPVEDTCPESSSNAVCFYTKDWDGFDTRNADHITGALSHMLDLDKARTFMALHQERLQTGGQLDPRVSQQMDGFMRRAIKLCELKQNLMDPLDAAPVNLAGTHIQAANVNVLNTQQEPSILARLFSGPIPQAPLQTSDVVEAVVDSSPDKKEES